MPSHLRLQTTAQEPITAHAVYNTSPSQPPLKKQRMSLTATYNVASTARYKLSRAAQAADHNLRLLVGHANLLDSLMVELQDAERQQEAWFNQSVSKATKSGEPRRVQWLDQITEDEEEESDSDDESDADEEDLFLPHRQAPMISEDELDAEYDDEDFEPLTRVSSHAPLSPPELTMDVESDSDSDEDMPPSPENSTLQLSAKQRKEREQITTSYYDTQDYAMQQPDQTLVAAC